MVFLHHNMKRILNNVDNVTDTWDEDMVNRRWIMTDAGLACVDCYGLDNSKHHTKKTIKINDDEWELKKKRK